MLLEKHASLSLFVNIIQAVPPSADLWFPAVMYGTQAVIAQQETLARTLFERQEEPDRGRYGFGEIRALLIREQNPHQQV
jgi:hypothetical protein